jgi:potassium-transporting ATPase KdpC subunit
VLISRPVFPEEVGAMSALALNLRRSLVAVVAFTIFFGFVYAFAGTGVAQVFFRHQADGSITANGSTLIGQNWNEYKTDVIVNPQWFHGRPDANNPLEATGKAGYSAASNLGPRSKVLVTDVAKLVKAWHKVGVNPTSDLVTTSASGLDPDISPQDARAEIPMVSKATGISPSRLSQLIAKHTNGPELGFLGSSTVNVLQLNEALAKQR